MHKQPDWSAQGCTVPASRATNGFMGSHCPVHTACWCLLGLRQVNRPGLLWVVPAARGVLWVIQVELEFDIFRHAVGLS